MTLCRSDDENSPLVLTVLPGQGWLAAPVISDEIQTYLGLGSLSLSLRSSQFNTVSVLHSRELLSDAGANNLMP